MKFISYLALVFFITMNINGCGEALVDVTNEGYQPRIVIEGFLEPGKKVSGIHISRNFRLDQDISQMQIFLPDADVRITDNSNGTEYPLEFFSGPVAGDSNFYAYTGTDFNILPGQKYTLKVNAEIEGQQLSAVSTTTVPVSGFRIDSLNFSSLRYRQRDVNNQLAEFRMYFQRSPGTTFYVISIEALEANLDNFIYENPLHEFDPDEVEEQLDQLRGRNVWVQNTPEYSGQSDVRLFWSYFWFYSRYRVVIYAADKNYRDFLQTFSRVQEADGNFHEAKMNIDGDGIGVFGSVLADTVYVDVLEQ